MLNISSYGRYLLDHESLPEGLCVLHVDNNNDDNSSNNNNNNTNNNNTYQSLNEAP